MHAKLFTKIMTIKNAAVKLSHDILLFAPPTNFLIGNNFPKLFQGYC
jgi:hypothetical protein